MVGDFVGVVYGYVLFNDLSDVDVIDVILCLLDCFCCCLFLGCGVGFDDVDYFVYIYGGKVYSFFDLRKLVC